MATFGGVFVHVAVVDEAALSSPFFDDGIGGNTALIYAVPNETKRIMKICRQLSVHEIECVNR